MIKFPTLITQHNTYLSITENYIPPYLFQKKYPHKCGISKKKVSLKKRNSRIIQIGHSTQWSSFLTLTFSPEFYWDDLKLIQNQFRAFIKSLYYEIGKFKYLAVLEYGKQTGRIHYHFLTDIPFESWIFEYLNHPTKKVCKLWDFGYSDVSKVDNTNCNAVFYLCKYLSKDTKDRPPIGKREVFSSRGLNKIKRTIIYKHITDVKGYKHFATSQNGKTEIWVKS